MERATIGLVGCGNIGMHIVQRLRTHPGLTILACEPREDRRAELEAMGIRTWGPEAKQAFLSLPMDAVAINAAGGTLDATSGVEVLRKAQKVYAPTELGGMMGYLTAVEEYLSVLEGVTFDVTTMLRAAERLETAGYEATARIIAGGHTETVEQAVTALSK